MNNRFCPQCGRQVGMEARFCGNCRCMLMVLKPRKTFLQGIKEGSVPAAGSWIGCLLAVFLWSLVTAEALRVYGSLPVRAYRESLSLLLPYLVGFPLMGSGLYLLAGGCFAYSKWGKLLAGVGITVAMCGSASLLVVVAPGWVRISDVSPEFYHYALCCVRGILVVCPLIQGSMFCIAAGRKPWKAVIFQAVLTVFFLVVSMVINYIFIQVCHWGFNGLPITCALAGVMSMIITLLSRIAD